MAKSFELKNHARQEAAAIGVPTPARDVRFGSLTNIIPRLVNASRCRAFIEGKTG